VLGERGNRIARKAYVHGIPVAILQKTIDGDPRSGILPPGNSIPAIDYTQELRSKPGIL